MILPISMILIAAGQLILLYNPSKEMVTCGIFFSIAMILFSSFFLLVSLKRERFVKYFYVDFSQTQVMSIKTPPTYLITRPATIRRRKEMQVQFLVAASCVIGSLFNFVSHFVLHDLHLHLHTSGRNIIGKIL